MSAPLPAVAALPGGSGSRATPRFMALGLSLALHGLLLGAAFMLWAPTAKPAEEKRTLVAACTEFMEPEEDSMALEEGLPPACEEHELDLELIPLASWTEESRVEESTLESPATEALDHAPLDLPDVPLEAVQKKVRRPVPPPAQAPASTASPTPRVAAPIAPPRPARRGARLRLLSQPDVQRYYPLEARRRGIEGTTVLRIQVDTRGLVIASRVMQSSGSTLLDRQALRFARDLRFEPGAGGAARLPVEFTLQ